MQVWEQIWILKRCKFCQILKKIHMGKLYSITLCICRLYKGSECRNICLARMCWPTPLHTHPVYVRLVKVLFNTWCAKHTFLNSDPLPRTPRMGHGHGHGCGNNGFEVFGFLAFLLAFGSLFNTAKRKKRYYNFVYNNPVSVLVGYTK